MVAGKFGKSETGEVGQAHELSRGTCMVMLMVRVRAVELLRLQRGEKVARLLAARFQFGEGLFQNLRTLARRRQRDGPTHLAKSAAIMI